MQTASEHTSNIWSGYASFQNMPNLPAEIGAVRNVFGKKNAREEVAKGVWDFLQEMAAKRGFLAEESKEES